MAFLGHVRNAANERNAGNATAVLSGRNRWGNATQGRSALGYSVKPFHGYAVHGVFDIGSTTQGVSRSFSDFAPSDRPLALSVSARPGAPGVPGFVRLLIIPLTLELLFGRIFLVIQPVHAVFENALLIFPLLFYFTRTVIDPVVDVLLLLFHRVFLRVPLSIELR